MGRATSRRLSATMAPPQAILGRSQAIANLMARGPRQNFPGLRRSGAATRTKYRWLLARALDPGGAHGPRVLVAFLPLRGRAKDVSALRTPGRLDLLGP